MCPQDCSIVPPVMQTIVKRFQSFLESSPLSVHNSFELDVERRGNAFSCVVSVSSSLLPDAAGFWSALMLRCSWRSPQQYMMTVVVQPKGSDEDLIASELKRLTQAFPLGPIGVDGDEASAGVCVYVYVCLFAPIVSCPFRDSRLYTRYICRGLDREPRVVILARSRHKRLSNRDCALSTTRGLAHHHRDSVRDELHTVPTVLLPSQHNGC